MSDRPRLTAPPDGQFVQVVLARLPWYHRLTFPLPNVSLLEGGQS